MPNQSDGSNQPIDTLRLTDEQWHELSQRLDRHDPYVTGQRRHQRVAYRKLAQIAVAVKQQDGQWAKYIVRSRDISPGGIGFIHGSYIHNNSECRIILKNTHGQITRIDGIVKRCELLEGTAHHVGVEFNEEINIASFVADSDNE